MTNLYSVQEHYPTTAFWAFWTASLTLDLQKTDVKTTPGLTKPTVEVEPSPFTQQNSQDSEEQEAKDPEGLLPCEKSYPACAIGELLEFTWAHLDRKSPWERISCPSHEWRNQPWWWSTGPNHVYSKSLNGVYLVLSSLEAPLSWCQPQAIWLWPMCSL